MANKTFFIISCFISLCLSGCSDNKDNTYQGYAEGRYTYISAHFPGKLEKLQVERGTHVNLHDALFTLDPEPEQSLYEKAAADLKQAKAAIQQIQSSNALNQKNYERSKILLKTGTVTKEEFDAAQSAYEQSAAQLKQAQENVSSLEAVLHQSRWQSEQKTLYAPKSAIVFDTYFLPGEWVEEGQSVVALLAPQDIKIIFFVSEKMLSHLVLNQKIQVSCDACKKIYTARISFISPTAEYTPPVIYSDERRDKLVYRVEAAPKNPEFYHPGMPVKVMLN